jgi:tRNA-intron endonuclease
MVAFIIDNRIIVEDESTANKLYQKGFGERENSRLELSLMEGLFLLERGTLEITEEGNKITPEELMRRAKEEDFSIKYKVYKDLRERGFVVKTGLKFGAHFRVYGRGEYLKEHSRYLVHVVSENENISFTELARAVRLAQGVKKNMIFAVVDDEGDVTYYLLERITP